MQAVLDEFSNPDLSGRQKRIVYTAMWFLLGRQLDEAAMGTDSALQRMEARLRDDLRYAPLPTHLPIYLPTRK